MQMQPNAQKATEYVAAFSVENWQAELRKFMGNSAETMIAQEEKEQKYDKTTHPARLEKILDNWDAILQILQEELPASKDLQAVLDQVGISADLSTIGVNRETAIMTFKSTKDIRDKYVLSRLAWDLGVLDDLCALL